jgi:hypothetical protein
MPSAIRSRRSGIGKHQIVTFDLVRSGAAAQFLKSAMSTIDPDPRTAY